MRLPIYFFSIFFPIFASGSSEALPTQLAGPSVINEQPQSVRAASEQLGIVVVFLSSVCPCSHSHIPELKDLAQKYSKQFAFVGVHANAEEDQKGAAHYFASNALGFPVVRDLNFAYANLFKANRTPHAFVVLPDHQLAYAGGVSSKQHFDEKTGVGHLRNALNDLTTPPGKVKVPRTRVLGCTISR